MTNLVSFPGREPEDEPSCPFCHSHYPCHEQGFGEANCPRVQAITWFPEGEGYADWDIQAVQFRDYEFEGEIDLEDEQEGE